MFLMKQYNKQEGADMLIAATLLLACAGVVGGGVSYCTTRHEKIKINRVYEKNNADGQGVFYVVGEKQNGEKEVFENKDTVFYLKYASADLQANLQVGKTYSVKVNGFRIPFLSQYRNIISADLVPETVSANMSYSAKQMLEARYAAVLLNFLDQVPQADVCEAIKAITDLVALKDKRNAFQIKDFGNKYTQRYQQLKSKEALKEELKQVSFGRKITQLLFKGEKQALVSQQKARLSIPSFIEKARV